VTVGTGDPPLRESGAGEDRLRDDDPPLHGAPGHGLEVRRPAPLDLCDRVLTEPEDETILVQAGEHVAVREGRRVAEHLSALDGRVRRHDALEQAHELRRRRLPGRTISPSKAIVPRRLSVDGARVKARTTSSYWRDVYGEDSFAAAVYQTRHDGALAWIDSLHLPPGSPVLEIGCGAGFLTVALAARGLRVESIDSSPAMIASTRARLADAGAAEAVTTRVEDVHALSAPDGSYAAVVALGVVPWLHSPEQALREITRVLRPGGSLIITTDNRARLNFILDPRYNPVLVYPLKRELKKILGRVGRRPLGILPDVHYPSQLDQLIRSAGLEKRQGRTIGFGPFSFLGIKLFRDAPNPERPPTHPAAEARVTCATGRLSGVTAGAAPGRERPKSRGLRLVRFLNSPPPMLGIQWAGAALVRGAIGTGANFLCGCQYRLFFFGPEWKFCRLHRHMGRSVHRAFLEQYGSCTSTVPVSAQG